MARGYTRTRVRGCGPGAAELWAAALHEYDRRARAGGPWPIGEVRQVYDRSAYLEFRDEAISSTDPLGPPLVLLAGTGFNGPLATRVGGAPPHEFPPEHLAAGTRCRLRTAAGAETAPGYVVSIGGTMDVGIEPAALEPNVGPRPTYPDLAGITRAGPVFARAETAIQLLTARDQADGLGWLAPLPPQLDNGGSPPAPIQSLLEWWSAHLAGTAEGPPPTALLGRGPGATPSGDDILSGLLLALLRTTNGDRHARVREAGRQLVAAADERTTDISTALLAQAAQDRAAERIEAALDAILAPSAAEQAIEPAILEAAELGHTSGVDHLLGVLLAIVGVAPRIGDQH